METTQSNEGADTATSNVAGKLSRPELWNQLQNALSSRSGIDQVYWSSYGLFWAANAVLLVALFSTGDFPVDPLVPIVISIAGLFQFLAWRTIHDRVLWHLNRVEALMERIEEDIGLGERHALSVRLSESDYREFFAKGPSARRAVKVSIHLVGISWALLLVVSALRLYLNLVP